MTTRKAPKAGGRGRRFVLASVFFAVLMASAGVSPAFASDKDPSASGNGKSGPAAVRGPGGQVSETSSDTGSHGGSEGKKEEPRERGGDKHDSRGPENKGSNGKEDSGAPTAPDDVNIASSVSGMGTGASGDTGSQGTVVGTTASPEGPTDKDGEPKKPPSDKYNGPCTRHLDPPGMGTGHDWHRGEGVGHNVSANVEPPNPGGGGTGGSTTPTQEPLLPFTPRAVSVTVQKSAAELPEYLPYTGGESDALLAVAACAGMAGIALRRFSRPRLYSHRRIAR